MNTRRGARWEKITTGCTNQRRQVAPDFKGDRASLDPRRRRRERRDRFVDGGRDLQRGNRVAFEEVLEEVVEVGTRLRRQLHPIRGHRDGCAAIFAAIQAFTVSHGTVRPARMSSMPRSILASSAGVSSCRRPATSA
jgi:hypothetical protein